MYMQEFGNKTIEVISMVGPSPYQVLFEVGFYCDKSGLKKMSHTDIHTDIHLEGIQHKTPYYGTKNELFL